MLTVEPPENSAAARPSWMPSTTTILSAVAVVTQIVKQWLGLDLGADNLGNVAVGGAAMAGGGWLAWKGLKPMIAIVRAWRATRNGGAQ